MLNIFLCLCFCCLMGVFGDADEVKSVSVMEGDSVTLYTDLTLIQNDTLIMWKFGPQGTVIAKITSNKTSVYADVHDGMFRDRLQVEDQTGSLTITNITTNQTGPYQLTISGKQKTSYTFNVTIYEATRTIVICCVVVGSLMIVTALLIFYIWRKNTNTQQEAVQDGEEITYADPTFRKRQTHLARAEVENEVMYASVNKRR